jgi:membrane-bound lytic murein transglycosylase D
MIMAAIVIARNPQLYGFEVSAGDPLAYERVTVPNALDLKIIAEWIGTSVDELRELNPELRRTTTPMADHELKVPVGTAATITSRLSAGDVPFVRFNIHTVKRGETLASIARKYKVTQNELRAANDLSSAPRALESGTDDSDTHVAGVADHERVALGGDGRALASIRGGHLSCPARRHAAQHRAPLRHDRRPDQGTQPTPHRQDQRR